MKLYLVRGEDVEDFNTDLFVVAESPADAIEIWNDHCVANGWPRHETDDEAEAPKRSKTFEPQNIRLVLPGVTGTPYAGKARAIDWDVLVRVWERK